METCEDLSRKNLENFSDWPWPEGSIVNDQRGKSH